VNSNDDDSLQTITNTQSRAFDCDDRKLVVGVLNDTQICLWWLNCITCMQIYDQHYFCTWKTKAVTTRLCT